MQDILVSRIHDLSLLYQQRSEINQHLLILGWEEDDVCIHIRQDDLSRVKSQITIASMVNCTPHPITIEGIGELPPSGILPRVSKDFMSWLPFKWVRGRKSVDDPASVVGLPDPASVVGLPDPVEGLTFIVSGVVRDSLSTLPAHLQRPDVFAPDTADAIRNDEGQIVAVRGLVQ